MTVGKIYVGLLISENWKAYKQSQQNGQTLRKVSHDFLEIIKAARLKRLCFLYPHPKFERSYMGVTS